VILTKLRFVTDKLAEDGLDPKIKAKLSVDQSVLAKQVVNYQRHKAQLGSQRRYITDREKALPEWDDGEGGERWYIVCEDFVNTHDIENTKTNNLIFAMSWKEGGEIRRKYVSNICTDSSKSCDAYYVIRTWEYHLSQLHNPDGEFHGVTHIIRVGDSGPHFHNRLTLLFESFIQERYGVHYEVHTYCKRHAFGLCDSQGGGSPTHTHTFA
jgi:hypothetical protein